MKRTLKVVQIVDSGLTGIKFGRREYEITLALADYLRGFTKVIVSNKPMKLAHDTFKRLPPAHRGMLFIYWQSDRDIVNLCMKMNTRLFGRVKTLYVRRVK